MNTHVKPLTSQLQARLATRATAITNEANWAKAFRAQEQMTSYRQSKQIIAELTSQQVLDKELLSNLNEQERFKKDYMNLLDSYYAVTSALADVSDGIGGA